MASTSAGVNHWPICTSIAPWRVALAAENRMSVPQASLSLCFLASATVASVPAKIWRSRAMLDGGICGTKPSSTKGWKLSHRPFSAMSRALSSSIRWPCSMTLTPAPMARWMACGV